MLLFGSDFMYEVGPSIGCFKMQRGHGQSVQMILSSTH